MDGSSKPNRGTPPTGFRQRNGNDLAGGPNITPHESAIGTWSEEEFARAIRQGERPDGTAISTDMPWETFSLYTDEEVHAIWTYLQTVEPVVRE